MPELTMEEHEPRPWFLEPDATWEPVQIGTIPDDLDMWSDRNE